jgi:F420-dependent oxidoreductase-like protein
VRFAKPLARTREYVDIVRMALARERVEYHGATYELPLPGGPGKALHLMLHPVRDHLPIYLAAIGPKNLELCGEITDGWLPVFFAPGYAQDSLSRVAAGREKAGKDMTGFDVAATVPVVIGDDLAACADPVRQYASLYIGGMGSRDQNFYNDLACRMGFADAAARVQDLYLARDYAGAAAAVPQEFIDATSLIGPVDRVADRMVEFAEAGVTTLSVSAYGDTPDERIASLRAAAEALDKSGTASA